MKFTTVDGFEEEGSGGIFYLSSGDVVYLYDVLTTSSKEVRFLVRPFFEGEATEITQHSDITINYEHEGNAIIVNSLFKDEPVNIVGAKYQEILDKITIANERLGSVKNEIDYLRIEIDSIRNVHNKEVIKKEELELINAQILKQNEELQESLDSKKQRLSEVQDYELGRLRARDYMLNCLEHAGLDNWDGYDLAIDEYKKMYPEG